MMFLQVPSFQVYAVSDNKALTTEQCDPENSRFEFEFTTNEATGRIKSFHVSEAGRIATCINPSHINVYDEYGNYDFTINTSITKTRTILQWENDTLFIYLDFSGDSGSYYELIEVNGYRDYKMYTCPVNDDTVNFWNGLEQHEYELVTSEGRYYVKNGNLRYRSNDDGEDYALTENTSFQPWWLLSIPLLTVIIWHGFLRKKVKEWEEKHSN